MKNIPPEVIEAYFGDAPAGVSLVSGGMINATFLVETDKKIIVQCLSPIFGKDIITDYRVISDHLIGDGWKIPKLVCSLANDDLFIDTKGRIWRAFEFIESDKATEDVNPELYGAALAKLHISLAKLSYSPVFKLPHFHDTDYYAKKMEQSIDSLPDLRSQDFARNLLNIYSKMPALPNLGTQLIHGDPRTNNILCRNNRPFTFIDWDTVMRGTIWMDLGDMLRSLAEDDLAQGQSVDVAKLVLAAKGYALSSKDVSEGLALQATQLVAIELAMRFMRDYKDGQDGYFEWDKTKYKSRYEHNIERANMQFKIFNEIQNSVAV